MAGAVFRDTSYEMHEANAAGETSEGDLNGKSAVPASRYLTGAIVAVIAVVATIALLVIFATPPGAVTAGVFFGYAAVTVLAGLGGYGLGSFMGYIGELIKRSFNGNKEAAQV